MVGMRFRRMRAGVEIASPMLFRLYRVDRFCWMSNYFNDSRRSFVRRRVETREVRVRFAPSPTGHLHLGGARTALFNYLFARSKGGKFVLRIEDTDLERSTKESEEAVLRDLSWLGISWDEGPDVGGDYGPYRQSQRNALYKQFAEQLLQSGHVYRCFSSNQVYVTYALVTFTYVLLSSYMTLIYHILKDIEEIAKLKWATADDEQVQEELSKGTPYTYVFRVPKHGSLNINDLIRGEVTWNLDILVDFVIMRSNGQPLYNFCVTVDDAMMAISHVIRAEEHLSNTLRQALIYKALGFKMPFFVHVPLILAPNGKKLSKRDGATSVGEFREIGYLPQAIVNYLSLLGWGDGTENEFFTLQQLVEKFTIERVNKSGAKFDRAKLRWMNGQHLRSLPQEELNKLLGGCWQNAGILKESEGLFVEEAVEVLKDGIDLTTDPDNVLSNLLSYPLYVTLASAECKSILEDGISEVAAALLSAYDNGELLGALGEGSSGWKKWIKSFGKSLNRKGKSLFMPLRVLLTGKLHGPDMGASMLIIYKASMSNVVMPQSGFVSLDQRFEMLRGVYSNSISKDQPLLGSAMCASH